MWINDAAVAAIGRFDEVSAEDHARVVDVNLKGTIYGSHAALRQFRRQGFGTLVNVASVEGRVPLAYQASYAATKAAIVALDAALNQELRLNGASAIKVVTIEPWAVDTPFYQHAANYTGHATRMSMMDGPWETVDSIVGPPSILGGASIRSDGRPRGRFSARSSGPGSPTASART